MTTIKQNMHNRRLLIRQIHLSLDNVALFLSLESDDNHTHTEGDRLLEIKRLLDSSSFWFPLKALNYKIFKDFVCYVIVGLVSYTKGYY